MKHINWAEERSEEQLLSLIILVKMPEIHPEIVLSRQNFQNFFEEDCQFSHMLVASSGCAIALLGA